MRSSKVEAILAAYFDLSRSSIDVRDLGSGSRFKVRVGSDSYFVKCPVNQGAKHLEAEHDGLEVIRGTEQFKVPNAFLIQGDSPNGNVLMLQWLDLRQPVADDWEEIGRCLAGLHGSSSGSYGYMIDNYIGQTEQNNTPSSSWIEFFRDRRLEDQRRRCIANGLWRDTWTRSFDSILHRLDQLVPDTPEASLVHGDFWRGNCGATVDGVWTFDPAVYYGHSEVDLAMSELFGGFGSQFYLAYREIRPEPPNYEDLKAVYNLYHLLNHINLFGQSYSTQVEATLQHFA